MIQVSANVGVLAVLGVLSVLLAAPLQAADQVEVTGGVIEGTVGTDPAVRLFKGVPFAAPPVGDLRWKAPQPVVPWKDVRKADTWGTRCVQGPVWGPLRTRDAQMGEDCLYLNVWTTARSAKEKRPVLVVIPGGGFVAGSASEPRTDGEWFAKQGIVVVEANYRLGVLGFLGHPELTREGGPRGSGNYGMLDQAAALLWVKENVAAFGGDPGNVTINGESAGSLSVSAHMVSPLTKDLVHKAIGQSGAFFETPTPGLPQKTVAEKEQDGLKFAAAVGADVPRRASRQAGGRAPRGADEGGRLPLQPRSRRVLHAGEGRDPLRGGKAGQDPARCRLDLVRAGHEHRHEPPEAHGGQLLGRDQEAIRGSRGRRAPRLRGLERRGAAAGGGGRRERLLHRVLHVEVDRGPLPHGVGSRLPLPVRPRPARGERLEPVRRRPRGGHRVRLQHARLEEGGLAARGPPGGGRRWRKPSPTS